VSERAPGRRGGRLALAALAAALPGLARAEAGAPAVRFTDATPASGIEFRNVCGAAAEAKGWLNESMGSGAAWLDYDGDGKLDLYLVNGSTWERGPGAGEPDRLYRGDGKGRFTDVTDRAGVGQRGWGYGVAVGDVDNDGDPDLFVTNLGPNVLYRNNGDGTFSDVTAAAGLGRESAWSTSAAFFDMEGDRDLDLYVANYMETDPAKVPRRGSKAAESLVNCQYRGVQVFCGPLGQVPAQDALYRNNGDGTFSDVTLEAGMRLDPPRYALGVVVADYDEDGDSDVYVANDSVQNSLWNNRGEGKFVDVGVGTLSALTADGRAQAGMGADFGDFNNDGWVDLVVTNFSQDVNTIYRNVQGNFFVDDSALVGMGATWFELSWGTGFHDFDRDGDLDLFIANGHVYPQVDGADLGTRYRQRNHLFLNERGRMREASAAAGPGFAVERSFRGAAFADHDDDGDVDVLVTALDEAPLLLRNDTTGAGHYLQIRLIGSLSNRDGVGVRVAVLAGGRATVRQRQGGGSYLSASEPRLHFGLGDATRADKVEILWPSGARDELSDVPADRAITVREGRGIAATDSAGSR
jgi:hypothetical protein